MIARADLGALEKIDEGGFGAVFRVPDLTLPDRPVRLAYKEPLSTRTLAEQRETIDAMERAVAFRQALSAVDRQDLDEYTAWPLALVEEGGVVCGAVMPLLEPDFFVQTRPAGQPAKSIVHVLGWLSAKESQVRQQGIDRSAVQDPVVRIALLAKLVYAVGRLHKHGAVYGDVSLKNAALATDPPRVKLLDCDGAAALNDPGRVQGHSPFFVPPEITSGAQSLSDDRTDVWKLGVCVVRGMQYGPGVVQTTDPQPLRPYFDAAAFDVVRRAVGDDRSARPRARELFEALERTLYTLAAPPVLQEASISRTTLPRGMQIEVTWRSSGGQTVGIRGANGLAVDLPDTGAATSRHVVTPQGSGDITVEVGNRHGAVRRIAGAVVLYDLPAFSVTIGDLPRPIVPTVPVAPPPLPGGLPAVPGLVAASLPAPRIELPTLRPILDIVTPLRAIPPPGPVTGMDLGGAAALASDRLRTALDDASTDIRDRAARQRTARRHADAPSPDRDRKATS